MTAERICPACRTPMLLVANIPGGYLCRCPRVRVLDVEAWRAEVDELRAQQRQAAADTMRVWRADARRP